MTCRLALVALDGVGIVDFNSVRIVSPELLSGAALHERGTRDGWRQHPLTVARKPVKAAKPVLIASPPPSPALPPFASPFPGIASAATCPTLPPPAPRHGPKIPPVHRTALFSRDRRFRYRLGRRWGDGAAACFVLLNPSTADETREDPTVRHEPRTIIGADS